MKVGLICDSHFGARKNSKLFHDYFLKFYEDVFFPTIDEAGITEIVHMGDVFDSRKGIDFSALSWAKDNVFDPIKDRRIKLHLLTGNHDVYYKNSNKVNAVDLLLREYENVITYSDSCDVKLDNLKVLFIPWINSENQESIFKHIKKTDSQIVMGHLELNGFKATHGHIMEHGIDAKLFDKFDKVYSGHYHTRSDDGKIFYLGNPYQMFWNDAGDTRGFHIFDTETLEIVPVNNPYCIFYKIFYDDIDYQLFDARPYENKIVKLIVRTKSDIKQFEKFVDKLYTSGVNDLKIVENFDFSGWYSKDAPDEFESEDTMSILNRYIEEADVNLDKSTIQKILQEVYQEACEMI